MTEALVLLGLVLVAAVAVTGMAAANAAYEQRRAIREEWDRRVVSAFRQFSEGLLALTPAVEEAAAGIARMQKAVADFRIESNKEGRR